MESRFQYCLSIVIGNEGGYVDHPNDKGGATNYGVTQAVFSRYLSSIGMSERPVSSIRRSEVEAIYHQYWKDACCARLPDGLDLIVYDMAINSGAGRAIKTLQKTLGVDVDGICGRQTLDALHEEIVAGGVMDVCHEYLEYRREFYYKLVERDASQKVFLKGWLNRLQHLTSLVDKELS